MDVVVEAVDVEKRFSLHQGRSRSIGEALYRLVRGGPAQGERRDDNVWALKGVSFALSPGRAVALVGHNGSGKSTMLKLVAGILRPTAGRVRVKGLVSPLIELAAGFHPDFTGRENVYLNGLILGLSRRYIEERFDRIVDFSGIADFIDVPVKYYSSGMYMRLAFSVATQVDPAVLLVDEILAVGDEEFQAKCIARIENMRKAGTGLLLVSHSRSLVASTCDEVLWLDHGSVKFRGSADEFARQGEPIDSGTSGRRLECEVVDAAGEAVRLGAYPGSTVTVHVRIIGGGGRAWQVGVRVGALSEGVGGLGPPDAQEPRVEWEPGQSEGWLRVGGLRQDAAYVLRAWVSDGEETLWTRGVEFGTTIHVSREVHWEPMSRP